MSSNPLCDRCQIEEEDVMHAIRDCCKANVVWNLLLSPSDATEFFGLARRKWLLWILRADAAQMRTSRWTERLLAVAWLLWRWRNAKVFEGTKLDSRQRLRQVIGCFENDKRVSEIEEEQRVVTQTLVGARKKKNFSGFFLDRPASKLDVSEPRGLRFGPMSSQATKSIEI